jgi:hypothetical protein
MSRRTRVQDQEKAKIERRIQAITAALSLNRGEIDPARLEGLLELIEPAAATPKRAAA